MSDRPFPYEVAFDFTGEEEKDLREGIYTTNAGKRLIQAELGIEPRHENPGGDVRYGTDDPVIALKLIALAFTISAGGWVVIEPMPEGETVFHLPRRGKKYN